MILNHLTTHDCSKRHRFVLESVEWTLVRGLVRRHLLNVGIATGLFYPLKSEHFSLPTSPSISTGYPPTPGYLAFFVMIKTILCSFKPSKCYVFNTQRQGHAALRIANDHHPEPNLQIRTISPLAVSHLIFGLAVLGLRS